MTIHLPAFGLPVHPRTGLTALGLRRNGAPIWPVLGASPDDPADPPGDPGTAPPPADPADLGEAGKQAIDRMKLERNAARTELRDAKTRLAALEKAEQDRADADKSEAEKRTAAEQRAQAAELRATKLDVAFDKGLTPAQAKRLVGATREELEADADEVLRDFPAVAAANGSRTPKQDPSQGARGGAALSGRDAGLAEAQKRFGKKPAAI